MPARILDLDLERATPFKLKDVYRAALVEDDEARGPLVRARHLMIKRPRSSRCWASSAPPA